MPICTCVHQSQRESMRFARDFTKSCNGWSGKSLSIHHIVGVCCRKHGFPLNSGKPNTSANVFGSEGCEFNIELALHTKHHQEINLVLLMRSILN